MSEYLAHISEDKERSQTIENHARGVAELAKVFAEAFGYEEWGYCAGILHDIGKYSRKFQQRIRGEDVKVDHSTAGAQACWERKGWYTGLSYCIAGHLAGLPDTGEKNEGSSSGTMRGRLKKNVENYEAYLNELEFPPLTKPPFQSTDKERNTFVFGFFIRMIYSCLVDADFLDTEEFMKNGKTGRDHGETIEVLCERLNTGIQDWLKNDNDCTINGRRTLILKSCMETADNPRGFFRLTVPTGGGKTMASLAFTLKHAKKNKMDRVIYVIPYTSIIEQNAEVFRNILGGRNVLENHCNVEYDGDEELHPMQLAAENWDKPVVVTTNVQFFESFFSNRSSKCRKLHNVANSVIAFDEAQMLPNDYLKPCVEVMEELVRYYNSTVVLCTATQPALQTIFSNDIKWEELCPDVEKQFQFFKRVTIKNLGTVSEEGLLDRLSSERQVLCIMNTKRTTAKVFREIRERVENGTGVTKVFHLSTSMYPKHRKRVLKRIRECLEKDQPCIVIATSLVEAGVDLDFRAVYRQLAGLDSVIQAAGRRNREGKFAPEDSFAYIFQLEDAVRVPGQDQQIAVSRQVIQDQEDVSSLEAIQEYFELLYHYKGDSLDKKNILGQFRKNRFPFAKVSDEFKLIEQNTKTIFIPVEESARKLLEEARWKGLTKSWMREAGQYCVNVYEGDFRTLYSSGILVNLTEDMKSDMYVLNDVNVYSEESGLMLEVDTGQALFF
ncbi:MAG: CRISPR-associated helicase Cas3' [Clostridiales bacterium]|nr:CRISPR-associated helicase Cas3' [Clostridiales bacterium]